MNLLFGLFFVLMILFGYFALTEYGTINGLNNQVSNLNTNVRALRAAKIVYEDTGVTSTQCVGTCTWTYGTSVRYANVGSNAAMAANLTVTFRSSADPAGSVLCQVILNLGIVNGQSVHGQNISCTSQNNTQGDSVLVEFRYLDRGN
jgi:hypothetical protein